ncbi:cob(I)yrinic acid a,c-diamide adenosyltransferase [Roseibacillus ishigakijimensis]|uniref:Corrinoid adenosyltransferase n=1 Tax=Roseibacillus ishigakijimensis TaxID=454146 RepID=A0A934VMC4_9BACT|nr:cob(I)yrinic acid a,c-diamide adenosyltransferase [Roseibacillus ishigakijimensis]MBK1835609.1 cob(I)yrinic acid a,c-diamide adenosyltransferase [Roseibacillus ishigakijimensis]
MSIITKRGDQGETDLLFGHRAAKTSVRVAALGAIDELNAALGLVRCHGGAGLNDEVDWLQEKLVGLMGELATLPQDAARYAESGMPALAAGDVTTVEERAAAIEQAGVNFAGWARPGAAGSLAAAHLDVARTVARRAERAVLLLTGESPLPLVTLFLNRLSDYLWLLARREEG